MRQTRRASVAVTAIALASTIVQAHDFWIEPSTFRPELGVRFAVGLFVGQELVGEPVPRRPQRIERFVLLGRGTERIGGKSGAHPAGSVRAREPGLHVVVYESDFAAIVLEAPRFEAYLRAEGLERIVALRAERGEADEPGREIYARCAKALVRVGGSAVGEDRVVGLPLELVAIDDPYDAGANGAIEVRLLFRGAPLAGALVVGRSRAAPAEPLAIRTDSAGRARLALAHPGLWLVKAVHMVEAEDRAPTDWASYWASLTFEIGAGLGQRPER